MFCSSKDIPISTHTADGFGCVVFLVICKSQSIVRSHKDLQPLKRGSRERMDVRTCASNVIIPLKEGKKMAFYCTLFLDFVFLGMFLKLKSGNDFK